MTASPAPGSRRLGPAAEAVLAAAAVTAAVGAGAHVVPRAHVATFVGLVFLGATWLLVWRRSDAEVERFGVAFGGLLLSGKIEARAFARRAAIALAWAAAFSAVIAVPYYFGWMAWWRPLGRFALEVRPLELASEALGQLLLIALPEEAFYRGYLQTRLDDAWPRRVRVFGATFGPGLVAVAAVFALGHVVTIRAPARLGVFFPALLFGWLRARTGGVGASVVFHAFCNVYSELLGRGYGAY